MPKPNTAPSGPKRKFSTALEPFGQFFEADLGHGPDLAAQSCRSDQFGDPRVVVGGKPGAAPVNMKEPWGAIGETAGLDDVRIHDLRHSFASVGAARGMSLPIVGTLLGHTQAATAQRSVHLSDDPLQVASDAIAAKISAAMRGGDAKLTAESLD